MDEREARNLLSEKLAEYRALSYATLASRIAARDVDCTQVVGPSGVEYQIEVQFCWDDRPSGNIRVIGAIDDGGLRAFVPLCDSFIMAPDGRFVGENAG